MQRLLALSIALVIVAGGVWLAVRASARFVTQRLTAETLAADELDPRVFAVLTRLDTQALEPLADAAASAVPQVAARARHQILTLVERWRERERMEPRFNASPRLLTLVAALDDRVQFLPPSGRVWLEEFAATLLRDPPKRCSPDLIAACDELLIAAGEPSDIPEPRPVDSKIDESNPAEPPLAAATNQRSRISQPPSSLAGDDRQGRAQPYVADEPDKFVAVEPMEVDDGGAGFSMGTASPSRSDDLPAAATEPLSVGPASAAPSLQWSPPSQPAKPPVAATPAVSDSLTTTPLVIATLANLPDRALIRHALTHQESPEFTAVAALLVYRGFGGASAETLRAAVSEREAERLGLVDRLLSSRDGNATRLLLLLATDTSPRVRAAAIGILGRSGDPQLRGAAERFALRDPDPQVARLATEIQRR